MSLSVLPNEHGGYGLYRGDDHIGWVEGSTIALLGFDDPNSARHAAGAARDALRAWLVRQRITDFVSERTGVLRMKRATTGTQLLLDGVPVGRIIQPARALPQGGYGFELLLPSGVSTVAGIGAAQVIYTALVRRAALRDLELTARGA